MGGGVVVVDPGELSNCRLINKQTTAVMMTAWTTNDKESFRMNESAHTQYEVYGKKDGLKVASPGSSSK